MPVVIDVEAGGFDPITNALLELCAVPLVLDAAGNLQPGEPWFYRIEPYQGLVVDKNTMKFLGYDPFSALRLAHPEEQVMHEFDRYLRGLVQANRCSRAILIGHNAFFDLAFVREALRRHNIDGCLHSFSTLDTVTLGAVFCGQTVLRRLCEETEIGWDEESAHSALYDCQQTALLFCLLSNRATQQA